MFCPRHLIQGALVANRKQHRRFDSSLEPREIPG